MRSTQIQKNGQLFVVIPTHNRKDILCKTLRQVREQLSVDHAKVIVVDAGSSDGTQELVKSLGLSIEIVQGSADMWWTATVNHGLSAVARMAAKQDLLILMNDDVDLAPNALTNLVEAAVCRSGSIVGAVNIIRCSKNKAKQKVYFCGGRYDLLWARHSANFPEGSYWQAPKQRFLDTDFLYGRLLIFPWEAFDQGHRFNAKEFPQYCADEEFTYAARLRGIQVLIDCKSVVYVNKDTTAKFSMRFSSGGLTGMLSALKQFNSCYNLAQNWAFARRFARLPIMYMLSRYAIILFNENFRKR